MAAFNAELAFKALEKQMASLLRLVESSQRTVDEQGRSIDTLKKSLETLQRSLEAQEKLVKVLVETRGAKKEEAVGKLREQLLTAEDRKALADMRTAGEETGRHRTAIATVERELKDLKEAHNRMGRFVSGIDIAAVQAKADRELKELRLQLQKAEAEASALSGKQTESMRVASEMTVRLEKTLVEKMTKEMAEQTKRAVTVDATLRQLEARLNAVEARR